MPNVYVVYDYASGVILKVFSTQVRAIAYRDSIPDSTRPAVRIAKWVVSK